MSEASGDFIRAYDKWIEATANRAAVNPLQPSKAEVDRYMVLLERQMEKRK